MDSFTSPDSSNPHRTPSLYLPSQLNASSSPLNDVITTPRDGERMEALKSRAQRGGAGLQKSAAGGTLSRRSVRVRESSESFSSSPFNAVITREELPGRDDDRSQEVTCMDLGINSSSIYPSSVPTPVVRPGPRSRPARAPVTTMLQPQPPYVNTTLALAQAHGISPDQFEIARRSLVQFLREPSTSLPLPPSSTLSEDRSRFRPSVSRQTSFTSLDTAGDLLAPLTISSRNHSPAVFPMDTSGSQQHMMFSVPPSAAPLAAPAMDLFSPVASRVQSQPSLEEMVARSGRKKDRIKDQDLREWAEDDQGYESDEPLNPRRAYGRRTTVQDQNDASASAAPPTLDTSPETAFASSPALRFQPRPQVSPLPQPTPKAARGMLERFMDDRSLPNVGEEAPRLAVPQSPLTSNKAVRSGVLFSPDVARLLRNELEELGANSMPRVHRLELPVEEFVIDIHSSPARAVQVTSYEELTPGLPTTASKRARDLSTEDSLKRSRRADAPVEASDRSPCPLTASLNLAAPAFGDSSPALSEGHLSMADLPVPMLSAPGTSFHYEPSSVESSPMSAVNSESDYAPTPHRASPPASRQTTVMLNASARSSTVTLKATASTSAAINKKRPSVLKRSDTAPGALGPDGYAKPPWSYAALIGQAIYSTDESKISLADVYTFIMASYPYYKKEDSGWQNSIRHNLSLNDCFVKTARGLNNPGKGCLWAVASGCEEQFVDGGFLKRGTSGPIKKARVGGKPGGPAEVPAARAGRSRRRKDKQDTPDKKAAPRVASPAFSVASTIDDYAQSSASSPPYPTFHRSDSRAPLSRSPSLPLQSLAVSTSPSVELLEPFRFDRSTSAPNVPVLSAPVDDVDSRSGLAPAHQLRPSSSIVTLPAISPIPSTATKKMSASKPRSTTTRRSTTIASPASPPTSVYTRLSAPYRPSTSTTSVQNHRALALLASPEAAGSMPVHSPSHGILQPSLQVPAQVHDPFQRASFLPAFNVFPTSAGRSRQRTTTSEGLTDFAMAASPSSYTRSPISSLRGSAPHELVSADPEKKRSVVNSSPRAGKGLGVRHHLPLVAALAEAGSKTPPRPNATTTHARSRSIQQFGTPARSGVLIGASPGWGSWADPYGDSVANELESFGGEAQRGSPNRPSRNWASPSAPAAFGYAAW